MATKTFEISFDGDAADPSDGWVYDLGIAGSISLYRVRVKKSSSGGTALLNIDAATPLGKNMNPQDMIIDVDPYELTEEYADGDDVLDVPNPVDGLVAASPSGDEAEFKDAGANISSYPALEFGGGDCQLVLNPALSFASGEPFSIAVVIDEGTSSGVPVIGSDVGSGTYASYYGNTSSRLITVQDESGKTVSSSARKPLVDEDIRVLTRDTSDTIYEYKRGVQTMTGTLDGTFKPQILCNARELDSWNTASLSLTRVIIAEGAWTTAERQDVEGWLAWKYGLQDATNTYLPATHPYYQGTSPITARAKAYNTSIDLSALGADTYSSWQAPDTSTITNSIKVYVEKAYKIGTITAEIVVSY